MPTRSHPPSTAPTDAPALHLRAILGPYVDVYTIAPGMKATIGRVAACEICLVHESVSRRHATLFVRSSQWRVLDEGSSGGTFLNGVRITSGEPVAISQGDLLRIGPWTFRADFTGGRATGSASVFHTLDDSRDAERRIERIAIKPQGMAAERLRLLTECLAQLHAATGEAELARIAIEHAVRGTGFPRGAVVVPTEVSGEVSLLASHGLDRQSSAIGFSRSLIAEAGKGAAVTLNNADQPVSSMSIAEMNVEQAMCAPVFLGETVCSFLYLDARRNEIQSSPDAGPFCEAVARAYGLALANAKRADLERRQQVLTAELQAARSVQQTITPAPNGSVGPISYAYHVEPGVFVAGDLFDVIPLDDGVVVFIGDVSGHGAGSGMLMALTQAHLNARLRASSDLRGAIEALNSYLSSLALDGRFVSLFLAKISVDGHTEFIDAGHGHWHVRLASGERLLTSTRDIPLGIDPERAFTTASLRLKGGEKLILYSDGVIEQTSPGNEPFGAERIAQALQSSTVAAEDVESVLRTLRAFAERRQFDDDATIASVAFTGV
jgi:sigma-B regulation protein RsbU (phosphoserine phosphatase)